MIGASERLIWGYPRERPPGKGFCTCRRSRSPHQEGTSVVNGIRVVEPVRVTVGDRQVASHVGLHLLGEIAERTGLAFEYSAAVPFAGERAPVHDRGRLLAQAAVRLAGGGICV